MISNLVAAPRHQWQSQDLNPGLSESGTSVLSPRTPCSPMLHRKVAGLCCAPPSWCACILGGCCWGLPQPPSVPEGVTSQPPP